MARRRFPAHGYLGLALVAVFWTLNWTLDGLRTHLCFFPLWLGYCLSVDGLAVMRRGTSLWTRGRGSYVALFGISAPAWWVFEAINLRTANWRYLGREAFTDLEYAALATLSFSTVVPAVLGTAELFAGRGFLPRAGHGPILAPTPRTLRTLAASGGFAFALLMVWPGVFFPLVWLSLVLVLESLNSKLGHRSVLEWTRRGTWGPVLALCCGAVTCGLFWELWNWRSFPKWVYHVPPFDFWYVFEMPLLGYLGYVPFSLELFAIVHLAFGLAGRARTDYVVCGLGPTENP